ncbi:SCO6745 family protein [Actinocorallia longicatena]|uniref:SalK n=1 Tax=Actinocorallia longicatena TaxID=111803 RepID=A0ABP6QAI5_9ACTN
MDDLTPARRVWAAVEPLHAISYFAPEATGALTATGLRGYWMGYFAGRAAPMGPVSASVVRATFLVFSPARVERALPDAWSFAPVETILAAKIEGASAALRAALPEVPERLVELMEEAAGYCRFDGRPLAAAWAEVPRPDDLHGRLWLAATVLREHRGDGHVAALTRAGLSGLEAGITHVSSGSVSRKIIQESRGWTDDEWNSTVYALSARGILTPDGALTPRGVKLREEIEDDTDRLALDPALRLENKEIDELVSLAAPLCRTLLDGGHYPTRTPVGRLPAL